VSAPPAPVVGEEPQPQQRCPIKSKVNLDDDGLNKFRNDIRASAKAHIKKHFEAMKPIHWIGKLIMNDDMQTLGLPEVGGVVNYLVDKKLFEVVYQNGKIETMDLEKLQRYRHIATLAGEDQDDIEFDTQLALWSKGFIDQEEEEDDGRQGEVEFKFVETSGSIATSASSSQPRHKGKDVAMMTTYKPTAASTIKKRKFS
ncbi:hypothetical protein LINPERHAP1_LOCUS40521, partial [Linum perenne]